MTYFAHEIKRETHWKPFRVEKRADKIRSLQSEAGVGDRLRIVAFAEIQARDGFLWGLDRFRDAPREWREYWREFSQMENRHAQLLLNRAEELELPLAERAVSASLFESFSQAKTPEGFFYRMATAEERGMDIGLSMVEVMHTIDPKSAEVFHLCAEEEVEHIEVARKLLEPYDRKILQEGLTS